MSFFRRLFAPKAAPSPLEDPLPRCGNLDDFEEQQIDGHPIARVGHLILTQAFDNGASAIHLCESESSFEVLFTLGDGQQQLMTPPKYILTNLLDYFSSIAGIDYPALLAQKSVDGVLTYKATRRKVQLRASRVGDQRQLDIELS